MGMNDGKLMSSTLRFCLEMWAKNCNLHKTGLDYVLEV